MANQNPKLAVRKCLTELLLSRKEIKILVLLDGGGICAPSALFRQVKRKRAADVVYAPIVMGCLCRSQPIDPRLIRTLALVIFLTIEDF